jgi:hypothetical protein
LSALRRPAKIVNPSAANFFAIAEPMKSPAPITAAVAFRFVNFALPALGPLRIGERRACRTEL